MKLFLILAVFTLVTISGGYAVQFSDCGTTVQDVKYAVSDCSDSDDECKFVIGTNVSLSSSFKVVAPIDSATIKLFGKLGPIPIPFKIKPAEACGNWGLVCPAAAGSTQNMNIQLPILDSYKPLKVGVRLELWDQKTKLICMQFPARLVNP